MDTWTIVKHCFGDTPLGIAKITNVGIVVDCNIAFSQPLGMDVIAMVGTSILDYTLKRDGRDTDNRFHELSSVGAHRIAFQKSYRAVDGHAVLMQVVVVPVWDEADPRTHPPDYLIDACWEVPQNFTPEVVQSMLQRIDDLVAEMKTNKIEQSGTTVNVGDSAHADNGGSVSVAKNNGTVIGLAFVAICVVVALSVGGTLIWTQSGVQVNPQNQPPETPAE